LKHADVEDIVKCTIKCSFKKMQFVGLYYVIILQCTVQQTLKSDKWVIYRYIFK